ncbi:MAG: hypothetical protein AAGF01_02010 [Cyanobacteria bacterium P01_G01_bin.38]
MGRLQNRSTSINKALQNFSEWLLGAARRIFSPTDDNYPETGVQPFEGDISDTNY